MPKILVVEDNENNRSLIRDILLYNGYDVIEASDGVEGIRMAKVHKPDLILMDMHMPRMDGTKAIRFLKADPETKGIKIIAITSLAMSGDRERILGIGCDGYITKPINTRGLPSVLNKFLTEEQINRTPI